MNRQGLTYRVFSVYGKGEEEVWVPRDGKRYGYGKPIDICKFTRTFISGLALILWIVMIGVILSAFLLELGFTAYGLWQYGMLIPFFHVELQQISVIIFVVASAIGTAFLLVYGITRSIKKINGYAKEHIPEDSLAKQRYRAWKDKVCYFMNFEN